MIKYKGDVLNQLKEAGYSTYRLRKEKLLGESTLTLIRQGKVVSLENINIICNLTKLQIGDILQHIQD